MVRLKPTYNRDNDIIFFASQFHYGSIKTTTNDKFNYLPPQSQFHYGSIKTKLLSK